MSLMQKIAELSDALGPNYEFDGVYHKLFFSPRNREQINRELKEGTWIDDPDAGKNMPEEVKAIPGILGRIGNIYLIVDEGRE